MQNNRTTKLLLNLIVASSVALTACGGDGKDNAKSPSASTLPTVPTSSVLSGKVIDGYIEGATVCLDLNNDQICGTGEPVAVTKAGGVYSLKITGLTIAQIQAAHLLTNVPLTAKDADDAGKTIAAANKAAFKLLAPANAFIGADGSLTTAIISPLTTMMSYEMISAQGVDLATAESNVRKILNLPATTDLKKDFIVGKDANLVTQAKFLAASLGEISKYLIDNNKTVTDKQAFLGALGTLQKNVASYISQFSLVTSTAINLALRDALTKGAIKPDGSSNASTNNPVVVSPIPTKPITNVTTSGYKWQLSNPIYINGAIETLAPSVTNLPNEKIMLVFGQNETSKNKNKIYASLGDYKSGVWETPVELYNWVDNYSSLTLFSTAIASNQLNGNSLAAWSTGEYISSNKRKFRAWVSSYNSTTKVWATPVQIGDTLNTDLSINNVESDTKLVATSSANGGMAIGWLQSSLKTANQLSLGIYQITKDGKVVTNSLELGTIGTTEFKIGLTNSDAIVATWSGINNQVLLAKSDTTSWSVPIVAGEGKSGIDLVVGTDGSGLVVWNGIDPSIHTAIFDNTLAIKSSDLLRQDSISNKNPSAISVNNNEYMVAFDSGSYNQYSSIFNSTSGWSTPLLIPDAPQTSSQEMELYLLNSGDIMAIKIMSYSGNCGQYFANFSNESTNWTNLYISDGSFLGSLSTHNNLPICNSRTGFSNSINKSSGRAVTVWSSGSQISSSFYR